MKNFLKFIFFGVTNAPKIELINPKNNEKKSIQTGFNFSMLFLSEFFGLPLFFMRLWEWAVFMFCVSTVQFWMFYNQVRQILSATTVEEYYALKEGTAADDALTYALLACAVLLAFKANEWAVKRLLKKGWLFRDPANPVVLKAVQKWKISKHYLKMSQEPRETL